MLTMSIVSCIFLGLAGQSAGWNMDLHGTKWHRALLSPKALSQLLVLRVHTDYNKHQHGYECRYNIFYVRLLKASGLVFMPTKHLKLTKPTTPR